MEINLKYIKLIALTVLVFVSASMQAQDQIILKSAEELKGKVTKSAIGILFKLQL